MASRRRALAPTSPAACVPATSRKVLRRGKRDALTEAISNALGLNDHEQLELELPTPRRRGYLDATPCSGCGRHGYHLARCPRRSAC